jgi:hypothetical protein
MARAVINVGYKDYILDAKDALTVLELLANAERYEQKYSPKTTTYHVYEQESDNGISQLKIIHDNLYRMAKLAGRPEK